MNLPSTLDKAVLGFLEFDAKIVAQAPVVGVATECSAEDERQKG
jgi:hypothetical protein